MYRIIFIDDELITVRMLEEAIDWAQYGIVVCGTASDGEEGIALFRQAEPDIAIVDIRMPKMNGIEFAEAIRQTGKPIKILILSAHAEFEYAQSAITYQISDYLLKPLDEDKLETSIARIVRELDGDNEVNSTIERYRLEQSENQLMQFFLKHRETADANTYMAAPAEIRDVLGQMDTLIYLLRIIGPHEDQALADAEDIRHFLKAHLGPHAAVIALSGVELIALTCSFDMNDQLDEMLGMLQRRQQAVAAGVSCIASGFDLIEAYRQAELAMYDRFYSGEALGIYSANQRFSEDMSVAWSEFEQPITELVEQGKCDELMEHFHVRLAEMFKLRVNPSLIYSFVYDILNWIKIAVAKQYLSDALAERCTVDQERLIACASAENLVAYLDTHLQQVSESVRNLLAEEPGYFIVRRAKEYTRAHYASIEFSLQDVADGVGLSKNHFSRVFRQTTGMKFWDYVTQLRIDHAKELLKQSNRPNYDICRAIGYESEFYFSKVFKRVVGVTAQEFRKL